jgi:hypothetical protein
MMEIRHVAGAPVRRIGAVVAPPGDFIYHAVAPLNLVPRERERRRGRFFGHAGIVLASSSKQC